MVGQLDQASSRQIQEGIPAAVVEPAYVQRKFIGELRAAGKHGWREHNVHGGG
jgi:hypothetical protein